MKAGRQKPMSENLPALLIVNLLLEHIEDSRNHIDERLVSQGQTIFNEVTTFVRMMLHNQTANPNVDAVSLNPYCEVTEAISFLFFSVLPRKDYEGFFEHISKLTRCY